MKKTGLLLYIVIVCLNASCFINPDRYKCSWRSPENIQFRKNQTRQRLNSAGLKSYVDTIYNVKVIYPDCFFPIRKEPGLAVFQTSLSECEMSFSFKVSTNNEEWEIKDAVEYQLSLSNDSTTKCVSEGKDHFIVIGRHFVRKTFLLNSYWVDFTFHYSRFDDEDATNRFINLVKEWDPRNDNNV